MAAELPDSLRARIADKYAKGYGIEVVSHLLNLSRDQVRDTLHALGCPMHRHGRGTLCDKPEWATYTAPWQGRLPRRIEDELTALYGTQQYADDPRACAGEPRFRGISADARAV